MFSGCVDHDWDKPLRREKTSLREMLCFLSLLFVQALVAGLGPFFPHGEKRTIWGGAPWILLCPWAHWRCAPPPLHPRLTVYPSARCCVPPPPVWKTPSRVPHADSVLSTETWLSAYWTSAPVGTVALRFLRTREKWGFISHALLCRLSRTLVSLTSMQELLALLELPLMTMNLSLVLLTLSQWWYQALTICKSRNRAMHCWSCVNRPKVNEMWM